MKKLTIQKLLTRQVAEVLPDKNGLAQLMGKRKIRLYLGIDPTGTDLHLGHTIGLRKLQQFADLGHEAVLVVGTGTVLAGDPSQRDSARPKITKKEIQENIRTWKRQASKILDFTKVKIKHNGDWLLRLGLSELLEVASNVSLVHLYQRDMFQRRIARGDTVWTHEALYPLLQGYDSVALDVDLEIGGTDQVFNMLVGRELQRKMNGKEKYVLTTPMISGLDGKTMSKTSGNTVNIASSPYDMYGRLMTVRDELVREYFVLLTDLPVSEVAKLEQQLSKRDFKARLAKELVAMYHGQKKAEEAEKEFVSVFREKKLPRTMPAVKLTGKTMPLLEALLKTALVRSKAEARRLVEQGGVRVDGAQQKDPSSSVRFKPGAVIQIGKRRFVRVS